MKGDIETAAMILGICLMFAHSCDRQVTIITKQAPVYNSAPLTTAVSKTMPEILGLNSVEE